MQSFTHTIHPHSNLFTIYTCLNNTKNAKTNGLIYLQIKISSTILKTLLKNSFPWYFWYQIKKHWIRIEIEMFICCDTLWFAEHLDLSNYGIYLKGNWECVCIKSKWSLNLKSEETWFFVVFVGKISLNENKIFWCLSRSRKVVILNA